MNMMEVCLVSNWVCAWDGLWRVSGKFPRWILVGRYGGFFCSKFSDRTQLGDLDRPVVGKRIGQVLGA